MPVFAESKVGIGTDGLAEDKSEITLAVAGHFPHLEAQQNEPKPKALSVEEKQQRARFCTVPIDRLGRACGRTIFVDMECCAYHALRRKT